MKKLHLLIMLFGIMLSLPLSAQVLTFQENNTSVTVRLSDYKYGVGTNSNTKIRLIGYNNDNVTFDMTPSQFITAANGEFILVTAKTGQMGFSVGDSVVINRKHIGKAVAMSSGDAKLILGSGNETFMPTQSYMTVKATLATTPTGSGGSAAIPDGVTIAGSGTPLDPLKLNSSSVSSDKLTTSLKDSVTEVVVSSIPPSLLSNRNRIWRSPNGDARQTATAWEFDNWRGNPTVAPPSVSIYKVKTIKDTIQGYSYVLDESIAGLNTFRGRGKLLYPSKKDTTLSTGVTLRREDMSLELDTNLYIMVRDTWRLANAVYYGDTQPTDDAATSTTAAIKRTDAIWFDTKSPTKETRTYYNGKYLPITNITVNTIAEMQNYNGNAEIITVSDSLQGSVFELRDASGNTIDSAIIHPSKILNKVWKRKFNGNAVYITWYGAKPNDPTFDSQYYIQKAFNNGKYSVICNKGSYYGKTYQSTPYTQTMLWLNETMNDKNITCEAGFEFVIAKRPPNDLTAGMVIVATANNTKVKNIVVDGFVIRDSFKLSHVDDTSSIAAFNMIERAPSEHNRLNENIKFLNCSAIETAQGMALNGDYIYADNFLSSNARGGVGFGTNNQRGVTYNPRYILGSIVCRRDSNLTGLGGAIDFTATSDSSKRSTVTFDKIYLSNVGGSKVAGKVDVSGGIWIIDSVTPTYKGLRLAECKSFKVNELNIYNRAANGDGCFSADKCDSLISIGSGTFIANGGAALSIGDSSVVGSVYINNLDITNYNGNCINDGGATSVLSNIILSGYGASNTLISHSSKGTHRLNNITFRTFAFDYAVGFSAIPTRPVLYDGLRVLTSGSGKQGLINGQQDIEIVNSNLSNFSNAPILYNSSGGGYYPKLITNNSKGMTLGTNTVGIPVMRQNNNFVGFSSAPPAFGTWAIGDMFYNNVASADSIVSWLCIAAPLTFRPIGTSKLDTLTSYTALRGYVAPKTLVYVNDFYATSAFSSPTWYKTTGGYFVSTQDAITENGCTNIIGTGGRKWKRLVSDALIDPAWFEVGGYDRNGNVTGNYQSTFNGIHTEGDRVINASQVSGANTTFDLKGRVYVLDGGFSVVEGQVVQNGTLKRANNVITTLTVATGTGSTSITVASVVGFRVGQRILITNPSATNGGYGYDENSGLTLLAITGISGNVITLSNAVGRVMAIGCKVTTISEIIGGNVNTFTFKNVEFDGNSSMINGVGYNSETRDWRFNITGVLHAYRGAVFDKCYFHDIPGSNIQISNVTFKDCNFKRLGGSLFHQGMDTRSLYSTSACFVINCVGDSMGMFSSIASHEEALLTMSVNTGSTTVRDGRFTNCTYVSGLTNLPATFGNDFICDNVVMQSNGNYGRSLISGTLSGSDSLVSNIKLLNSTFINCGDIILTGQDVTTGKGYNRIKFVGNEFVNTRIVFRDISQVQLLDNTFSQDSSYGFTYWATAANGQNAWIAFEKFTDITVKNNRIYNIPQYNLVTHAGISTMLVNSVSGNPSSDGIYYDYGNVDISDNTLVNFCNGINFFTYGNSLNSILNTHKAVKNWVFNRNIVTSPKSGTLFQGCGIGVPPGAIATNNTIYWTLGGTSDIPMRVYGVLDTSANVTKVLGGIATNNWIFTSTARSMTVGANGIAATKNAIVANNFMTVALTDQTGGSGSSITGNTVINSSLLASYTAPVIPSIKRWKAKVGWVD